MALAHGALCGRIRRRRVRDGAALPPAGDKPRIAWRFRAAWYAGRCMLHLLHAALCAVRSRTALLQDSVFYSGGLWCVVA